MVAKSVERPTIIFTEDGQEDALFARLDAAVDPSLPRKLIKTRKEAIKARIEDAQVGSGFFVLHKYLYRGTDVKLLKDAHVFINAVQGALSWSVVT